jgi:Fe-S cluster assembly ATP-binding protein
MKELDLTSDLLTRPLNSEVSGGENKRIELLQMAVINPKTLLLDEVDTGLDLDNQILIGNFLAKYIKVHAPAVIIVTHNMKFLSYFNCNHVVVLADGQVTCTGGKPLIKKIETKGFNGL